MVWAKCGVDHAAVLVIDHLLAVAIAQRLHHPPLDLPGGGQWIDGHPGIDSHDEFRHRDLPRLCVDLHLGKLPGKGWRRSGANIGRLGHHLPLVVLVQRVQRDALHRHGAAIRGHRLPILQPDSARVVQFEHQRRPLADLLRQRLGCSLDGRAGDVGR